MKGTPLQPLVRAELDQLLAGGCETGGCGHNHDALFLRSRCHPNHRGVDTSYQKAAGIIVVTCAVCEKMIAKIAVAETYVSVKDGQ